MGAVQSLLIFLSRKKSQDVQNLEELNPLIPKVVARDEPMKEEDLPFHILFNFAV